MKWNKACRLHPALGSDCYTQGLSATGYALYPKSVVASFCFSEKSLQIF